MGASGKLKNPPFSNGHCGHLWPGGAVALATLLALWPILSDAIGEVYFAVNCGGSLYLDDEAKILYLTDVAHSSGVGGHDEDFLQEGAGADPRHLDKVYLTARQSSIKSACNSGHADDKSSYHRKANCRKGNNGGNGDANNDDDVSSFISQFSYRIPLRDLGEYVIALKFLGFSRKDELLLFSQDLPMPQHRRLFDIKVGGHLTVKNLDILPPITTDTRKVHEEFISVRRTASDVLIEGQVATLDGWSVWSEEIVIQFVGIRPKINAIVIYRGDKSEIAGVKLDPTLPDGHGKVSNAMYPGGSGDLQHPQKAQPASTALTREKCSTGEDGCCATVKGEIKPFTSNELLHEDLEWSGLQDKKGKSRNMNEVEEMESRRGEKLRDGAEEDYSGEKDVGGDSIEKRRFVELVTTLVVVFGFMGVVILSLCLVWLNVGRDEDLDDDIRMELSAATQNTRELQLATQGRLE